MIWYVHCSSFKQNHSFIVKNRPKLKLATEKNQNGTEKELKW